MFFTINKKIDKCLNMREFGLAKSFQSLYGQ